MTTLREQVATALGADPDYPETHCELCREAWRHADEVVGVVLGVVADEIKAQFDQEREVLDDPNAYPREVVRDARIGMGGGNRALAAVERLRG